VQDTHGLSHISVLCEPSVDMAPGGPYWHPNNGTESFLCALCDYNDAIDAVTENPVNFKYPTRRWKPDQEAPGPVTCLFCLGA
jgi:hypothetical protein